jgi:AcrR family transcriptional regulator
VTARTRGASKTSALPSAPVASQTESKTGGATRERLLRAAEKLFADRGVGRASTRAILQEAGQRNESALQYHFGGRDGLIEALYLDRGAQIAAERERMLAELSDSQDEVSIRQLCEVAFLPPVNLARQEEEFGRFLEVVGQLAFLPSERLKEAHERYELGSVSKLTELVRSQLDLPPELIDRRLEMIHRLAAVSLAQWARTGESFGGASADVYFETVLDAMAAILSGPVSRQTKKALAAPRPKRTKRKKTKTGRDRSSR